MAAKTTTGAGSFTDGSKWGGSAPVEGDTLTINHAMTYSPTAGTSDAFGTGTGTAIAFGSGGSLTITPAGAYTLTLTGTISGTNVKAQEFVVTASNAASSPVSIVFDATSNSTGFQILTAGAYDGGSAPGTTNLRGWKLTGNATNRISVSSLPSNGTKNSWFGPTGNAGGGVVNAAYVDFLRIGDATNSAFSPNFTSGRSFALSVTNCTFTSCGQYNVGPDSGYSSALAMTDCTWSSSVTNGSTSFRLSLGTLATGTVTFTRCSWDKTVKFGYVKSATFSKCYFNDGWTGTHVTTPWTSMDGCFIRIATAGGGGGMITCGSVTNSFIYYDAPAGANPHFLAFEGSLTAGSVVNCTGNVAYFNGTDTNGNIFLAGGANASTFNCKNNLTLPNAGGGASGVLLTSDGTVGSGFAIAVEHNTAFVKGQWALEIGHLYTVVESPNRYTSVKSNLIIGGGNGYKALNTDSSTTLDLIPPANADYNGSYQIKTTSGVSGFGNEGKGYCSKWSATPGTHDVDGVNPAFVNSSASFANWAISQGSANTGTAAEADGVTYIKADLNTKIAALLAYFAAAYAPTAAAFKGTAHDGGDIGAYAWVSSGTYGPFLNFICGD